MFDYSDQNRAWDLSQRLVVLAEDYLKHRSAAAENKTKFDLILASQLGELRKQKSNLGIETAQIMLLERDEKEVVEYYTAWQFHEAQYRGLEKVIESVQGQISLAQSLMRNQSKQGGA